MFLLIDNYDSFTYNLYHYMREIGAEVEVVRNDQISVKDIQEKAVKGIVLSPGPCTPNEAGICLDLVSELYETHPILGVCLGHQTIAQVFGGSIVKGAVPMHAKVCDIDHIASPLFKDVPPRFKATRYHSLIIDKATLPACLEEIATSDDGVIQAISHREYPVYGVQFHPESIASECGHQILRNFVHLSEEASS